MLLLSVFIISLVIYYTYIWPKKRAKRYQARARAVRGFRKWVVQLERERFYRTGEPGFSCLKRLPSYDAMLDDQLPLKLDSYFHDSEINKLLGIEKATKI